MASEPAPTEPEESEVRIVLLGKTGVGKSTAGNLILGCSRFKTDLSPSSVTMRCQKGTREFEGQTVAVIDTPGLFRTDRSRNEVVKELIGCITWTRPGPHVLLLVLTLGSFSRQDKKILDSFRKVFRDAKRHTILLFTRGDQCKTGREAFIKSKKAVEEFVEESCDAHHVFSNEARDESQVTELLQKINAMVRKNDGRCYSGEMFREAASAFEEVMQQPEVKSATDPAEAAQEYLEGWIAKGVKVVEKLAPGLSSFLKKVEEVALRCMPAGAEAQ